MNTPPTSSTQSDQPPAVRVLPQKSNHPNPKPAPKRHLPGLSPESPVMLTVNAHGKSDGGNMVLPGTNHGTAVLTDFLRMAAIQHSRDLEKLRSLSREWHRLISMEGD